MASPYLRCDLCAAKRPLDSLLGDPAVALFCRNELACRLRRGLHHLVFGRPQPTHRPDYLNQEET